MTEASEFSFAYQCSKDLDGMLSGTDMVSASCTKEVHTSFNGERYTTLEFHIWERNKPYVKPECVVLREMDEALSSLDVKRAMEILAEWKACAK